MSPSALVLMYHRIGGGILADRQAGEHIYAVAPDRFARQLDTLAVRSCPVLGLAELEAALRGGGAGDGRADRAVALTFDDGNLSDYTSALPELSARGFAATFFVSPALVGRDGYASWAQLGEMAAAGMTIGGHGLDHTPLAALDHAALRHQMTESQRLFERHLGTKARFMSLPNGAGGEREVTAAHAAGFAVVLGSVPGRQDAGAGEPVRRIAVRHADSLARFEALVTGGRFALLRHTVRHRLNRAVRAAVGERLYQQARRALSHGA
jgi:peptidoglycan/xylan/chitin deacetylase (PgdA/CDA1 family)